jgi:hypothetical protein
MDCHCCFALAFGVLKQVGGGGIQQGKMMQTNGGMS